MTYMCAGARHFDVQHLAVVSIFDLDGASLVDIDGLGLEVVFMVLGRRGSVNAQKEERSYLQRTE